MKTYAIVEIDGRQELVENETRLDVNRMNAKPKDKVKLDKVLLVFDNGKYNIGAPYVKGAAVNCEVISHLRGEKVFAFKYRRRKGYKRKVGHRQDLTKLLVKDIKA